MPIYDNITYNNLVRPLPEFVEWDWYDIPVVEPQKIDISQVNNGYWLVNLKNTSSKDKYAGEKIVHAFCYDDELYRFYKNPYSYLYRTSGYYAVSTLDFSMSEQMRFPQILHAVFCNRWSGAFMQSYGRICIPTVGWVKPDSYDICFVKYEESFGYNGQGHQLRAFNWDEPFSNGGDN